MNAKQILLLEMLAYRLERLSVDSLWARRASGLRGNIIKVLNEVRQGETVPAARLTPLIDRAFVILEHAAQEIPDMDEIKKQFSAADQ
jgi:hypothetical protein